MKALVLHGVKQLHLEDLPDPSGAVVIKVKRAGICGTDLKAYLRGHHLFTPPVVLGHECYGVVVYSSLDSFREGEYVAIAPYAECGVCQLCKRDLGELCRNKIYMKTGCFSEFVAFSSEEAKKLLLKITDDNEVYVLAEPLACVLGAARKTGERVEKLLVVGGGPMGALFAIHFQLLGTDAFIVEKAPWRLNYLKQLGFNVISPEGVAGVYNMVVLCTDSPELIEKYLSHVEDGGVLLLFAGFPKDAVISLSPFHIHYREVKLIGSFGYKFSTFIEALNELSRYSQNYNKIITHRFRLANYGKAFEVLQRGEALKVILEVCNDAAK